MIVRDFGKHQVISPAAVDLDVAKRFSFKAKSCLFCDSYTGTIARNDIRLNAVKSQSGTLRGKGEIQ
jgi:hypothetical protein